MLNVDYKGFLKALGTQIKALRKSRGWSNKYILTVLGMSDTQWRRYERGGGLTLESLLRISACFDMSIGDLLNGLGQYPQKTLPEISSGAKKVLTPINVVPVKKASKKAAAKSVAKKRPRTSPINS